jgi:hypothetical protein
MGQQPLSLGNMEAPQQAISSSGVKPVIGFSRLKKYIPFRVSRTPVQVMENRGPFSIFKSAACPTDAVTIIAVISPMTDLFMWILG